MLFCLKKGNKKIPRRDKGCEENQNYKLTKDFPFHASLQEEIEVFELDIFSF